MLAALVGMYTLGMIQAMVRVFHDLYVLVLVLLLTCCLVEVGFPSGAQSSEDYRQANFWFRAFGMCLPNA